MHEASAADGPRVVMDAGPDTAVSMAEADTEAASGGEGVDFEAWRDTDIDVFVTVRSAHEGRSFLSKLYADLRAHIPADLPIEPAVSGFAVTFKLPPPYRSIQVILRLYHSMEQVALGFDLDACAMVYNGSKVMAYPRAVRALVRREILVDVRRQSTSMEERLLKYAKRGFRIAMPPMRLWSEFDHLYDQLTHPQASGARSVSVGQAVGALRLLLRFAQSVPDYRLGSGWRIDSYRNTLRNVCQAVGVSCRTNHEDYHDPSKAFRARQLHRLGLRGMSMLRSSFQDIDSHAATVLSEARFESELVMAQARREADPLFSGSFHPTCYDWYASPLA